MLFWQEDSGCPVQIFDVLFRCDHHRVTKEMDEAKVQWSLLAISIDQVPGEYFFSLVTLSFGHTFEAS